MIKSRFFLLGFLLALPLFLASLQESQASEAFLMPVADVFPLAGRGMVATGTVDRGTVTINETLELVGSQPLKTVTVVAIDEKGKALRQATRGQTVGLVLRGVSQGEMSRGQVLALPGSIKAVTKASAKVEMFTSAKGGLRAPVLTGYRPQLRLRGVDYSAILDLSPKQESLEPGQRGVVLAIRFAQPVPAEAGQTFEIRDGGRTVGQGTVVGVE